MLRLYNTALVPLRLAVAIWAAVRRTDRRTRDEWAERRARRLPSLPAGGAWIHGASVGEARIVAGLADGLHRLRPDLPLAVSAYTATGRARLPEPPRVDAAFFVPLDFPPIVRRVLGSVRPAALALVETELWPNLLNEARAADVPVVVVNARLSVKRMTHYRRLGALYRPLLKNLHAVGAQSDSDAARFRELGVPEEALTITGNVKYDLPTPTVDAEELRHRLGLSAGRPVLAAGSTGRGEEDLVLQAFEQARRSRPDLLLVLAPRHPERIDEVDGLIRERGFSVARRSTSDPCGPEIDVLLVDTVGELAALYQLATVAFVGGSLIPVGGHNLLEPAAVNVPVLFGPHVENCLEPAEALESTGGGRKVRDAAHLGTSVERLLGDENRRREMGLRAGSVVEANRGALDRSLTLLLGAVDAGGARSRTETA